ncbi:MAG: hypothetical protein K2V38_20295 [Gemmataceae bacterium]|nr:hypothetical protein [Gemmataceae bacterium]
MIPLDTDHASALEVPSKRREHLVARLSLAGAADEVVGTTIITVEHARLRADSRAPIRELDGPAGNTARRRPALV